MPTIRKRKEGSTNAEMQKKKYRQRKNQKNNRTRACEICKQRARQTTNYQYSSQINNGMYEKGYKIGQATRNKDNTEGKHYFYYQVKKKPTKENISQKNQPKRKSNTNKSLNNNKKIKKNQKKN